MRFRIALVLLWMATAVTTARAEPLTDAVRRHVEAQTRGLGERVVVEVPAADPRTRLGECAQPEIFTPPGTRLWGNTHVGVRCASPSTWLVYLPVHVKVSGRYLVSVKKLNAGQTLTDADFESREGALDEQPDGVLTEAGQARGQRTRTGVAAGMPLRRSHLQREPVIRQGQSVRVVVRGAGFTVSSEGVALTAGYEGEVVKVKNPSGKTVQGRALAGGVVEVGP